MGGLVPRDDAAVAEQPARSVASEVRGGYWQQAILDSLVALHAGLLLGSLLGAASGLACAILPGSRR